MNYKELLDRPIAYQRCFVSLGSGITGALMLSQAVYWSNRTNDKDGWFYKTQEEWTEETGMTRYEQETARKKLIKIGVLDEKKQGIPCKLYYRVNYFKLENLLQTSLRKSNKLVSDKPTSSTAENQHSITENTQEITTDINTSDKSLVVDNENIDRPNEDFAEEKIPIPDQPKKLKQKIPYQAIVDIYHEVLPELSEVLVLNEKRKRYLSARWQENKVHQTLDFWKDYFAYVRKSQFLMGNSVSTNGNKPFKADFEWLINPNNFVKVIEGKYVRNI